MSTPERAGLRSGEIGLVGVLMPGLAQVAPAFNLLFTTGVMASVAGSSVPLIFLISMVGMGATASTLAQFSSLHPSAGSFLTYISRSLGPKAAVTTGVITLAGYIIAFAGIYVFVASYIIENVFGATATTGSVAVVTVLYGALVAVPVIIGLEFGLRTTIALYVFEVVLLGVLVAAVLLQGGREGLSLQPFTWPTGSGTHDVFIAFSLAVLAFGGFEAAAPLAEETKNPRRNVPIALLLTVAVSGTFYVIGSYALVMTFGADHAAALAANPNPFEAAATRFLPVLAPVITYIFLSSVTSSYVAANTQSSRVVFAGARGGLWHHSLAVVSPRLRTPVAAVVAFVVPSLVIGIVALLFTDAGTAAGFLGTYGILGVIIMYVVANVALIVEWFKLRRQGIHKNPLLWVAVPIVGILVLAIPIWGDLRPGQGAPYDTLPWLTVALVGVGLAYMLVLNARAPGRLARAAELLEGGDPEETGTVAAHD